MSSIRPAKFVHVVYRTRRFEEMVQWYETVFGAKVQYRNPALAFLTYDDEHHRFAFANLDILKPGGAEKDKGGLVGVDHLAYTYASLRDLAEKYGELKARGIKPYWCVHHAANAYMEGPHFAANPIGVEFDPDDWLAKLRAGTPASEFLPRGTDEPVSPIRGSFAT